MCIDNRPKFQYLIYESYDFIGQRTISPHWKSDQRWRHFQRWWSGGFRCHLTACSLPFSAPPDTSLTCSTQSVVSPPHSKPGPGTPHACPSQHQTPHRGRYYVFCLGVEVWWAPALLWPPKCRKSLQFFLGWRQHVTCACAGRRRSAGNPCICRTKRRPTRGPPPGELCWGWQR